MSDLPLPDDELLSAYLDGELTAEERAALDDRLGHEPGLADRLAELRAAADLVATPVAPLAPDRVDDLVGAALAAGTTSPTVTDLAAASAARRRSWGNRVAVAAAAVILVALAVPALRANSDDDGSSETADAGDTDDSGDDVGGDDADGEATAELDMATEAADAATATFEEAAPTADDAGLDDADDGGVAADVEPADAGRMNELGAFDDLDQLRAAAVEEYGAGAAPTTTTVAGLDEGDDDQGDGDVADPEAASACVGEATVAVRALLDGADPAAPELTEATVAGEPVVVAVFPTDPGPTLVVASLVDCAVLDVTVLS